MEKTSTVCRLNEQKYYIVNDYVKTIYLESVDKRPVPNFKKHYHGFEILTKHFWIRCLQDPSVIRHYTICNAMDPDLYSAYVTNLDQMASPVLTQSFNPVNLDDTNQCEMLFSVKNYNTEKGVSKKLHTMPQRNLLYQVKGPMGKGLHVEPTGIHIAFAAGTGVLCFVDLVGHLI